MSLGRSLSSSYALVALAAAWAVCASAADKTLPIIVTNLTVSPDGKTVAVPTELARGGAPYAVYLFSLSDGSLTSTIRGVSQYAAAAKSVAFTPDNKTIVIGDDGGIRRFTFPSLTPLPPPSDPDNPVSAMVEAVSVSFDAKYLSACYFYSFRVWDLATDKVVYDDGPEDTSRDAGELACRISPDGKTFVASDSERHYECHWQTGTCLTEPGKVDDFAFSPDANNLAMVAAAAPGSLIDKVTMTALDTRKVTRSLIAKVPSRPEHYNHLTYSPDGKLLALGGMGIGILDLEKGAIRKLFYLEKYPSVRFLKFTPDNKRIVFVAQNTDNRDDFHLGVWDLPSQKMLWWIPIPPVSVN